MNEKEIKKLYRHSPISDIKSIIENGLNPEKAEENLRTATSDNRQMIFYSEGMEGVITFDCTCKRKYKQFQEYGKAPKEKTLDEFYKEHDGEDRVYLSFNGTNIENEQKIDNTDRFADACTSQKIPSKEIKVCILKNNSTGELSYKREDIIRYMMSKCSINDIKSNYLLDDRLSSQLNDYYTERQAERFDLKQYSLEEISLEQFYEKFVSKLKSKVFLDNEIGKSTLNISTNSKDNATQATKLYKSSKDKTK